MTWDINALRQAGTLEWQPGSGVEDNQGPPHMPAGELEALQTPLDPGIAIPGFINPYRLVFYGPILLSTTIAKQILPANKRRCYLLIQNQGPGNVYVNFGQNPTPPSLTSNSNGLQLVQTQALEQIGGGFMVLSTGDTIPNAFVSGDYISAITDTTGTTMLAGEGIWLSPLYQS